MIGKKANKKQRQKQRKQKSQQEGAPGEGSYQIDSSANTERVEDKERLEYLEQEMQPSPSPRA